MRKVIAHNKQIEIVESQTPTLKPSYVLIRTMHSVISPGTELSILHNSTDKKIPLGYSAMGIVEECGSDITDVKKGDLVACYGAPYVHHAEKLLVPKTLYAKIPENVSPKEAAFAGIGAIAIHALRTAKLEFGETVVVVGLGLLGQMIAKIANAAAYHVIAYDLHAERVNMLHEDTNIQAFSEQGKMEAEIQEATNGNGADAVLLCAGGKRSALTHESLKWIRNQGKVVIVGDVEPDFPRDLMFSKEAQLLISRAGGPGRYDKVYEAEAMDYPYGYVRWTEGRNVAAYLRLVSKKQIDMRSFVTDEVRFDDVVEGFEDLMGEKSATLTKLINFMK